MSDTTTSKSWGSTIVIGIILLVLAVGLIFFIYYIFLQTNINPYPVSQFKFGDTIQISPAVFVRETYGATDTDQNQYLVKNSCASYPCAGCYLPSGANSASCVVTFSGNKNDPSTKWVLEKLPYDGDIKQSTDQTIGSFGNRFYLRNATNSPGDLAGRVRMNLFNSTLACQSLAGPDKSFTITSPNTGTIIGNECYDPNTNFNEGNELIVYFWPSSQPDLYYILFPGTLNGETRAGSPSLTTSTNDGVVTLRPYAPFSTSNTYNPFMDNGELYNNGTLLNAQGSYPVGIKYPKPEVFLFKVTKAT